jgi:hypothetical protein
VFVVRETVVKAQMFGSPMMVEDEDLSWLGERSGRHVGSRYTSRAFRRDFFVQLVIFVSSCFACNYIDYLNISKR